MPNGRFLWASLVTIVVTFVCASSALLAVLFRAPRPVLDAISRTWASLILKACQIRVELSDLEHLPAGSSILVGNHQGMLDILALMSALPHPPVFAAKAELFKIPLFGQAMRSVGHIPIYRGERDKAIASINAGAKVLQKTGHQLVFFPEGTRTRDGHIQGFKKGAFVFALESQLPLVPFAINGSYQTCPPGLKKVYAGTIQVRLLPPIDVSQYDVSQRDVLTQTVREQIVTAVAQQQEHYQLPAA